MAHAEIDRIGIAKVFDRQYEAAARRAARSAGERALKSVLTLGAPGADRRYGSLDLGLTLALDEKTRELQAGCGVIVNIREGSRKFMHMTRRPNSASTTVVPERRNDRDVERLIADAVEGALDAVVSRLKSDRSTL